MAVHDLTQADRAAFKRELGEVIPHLRAFARGLCGRPDMADDLVQETMLKAWAAQDRFEPGTSMRAWTFVILRNAYLTEMRRNRFRGEYDEVQAERILVTSATQEEPLHLSDMRRALMSLPDERREALLLVGAGGFSYEEAAQICECPVGTIKSRVGRARAALTAMLDDGQMPDGDGEPAENAHAAILHELERLTRPKPAAALS
ncbi:sigma-70 family RNA polymerase sigma factor [Altererythrobacter sp. H2]|uniref:sigma-70 family RNA polymerase sigma factor n=1 Tax=Altererythrobacter sp. H2 TaxID=3108391 RepID=UPI000BCBF9EB|nr:sigma-70 family RNA polymerase sigma factor [Altererythrobacter sp. H2]OZA94745.1 MAG: RNA polymerase subunit sigma-70 [Erythrobacter sp. 34-65-8]WRK96151.1 sigma-70 family RNA polymerase sigma factor [Altererythrobacter sp. H2]